MFRRREEEPNNYCDNNYEDNEYNYGKLQRKNRSYNFKNINEQNYSTNTNKNSNSNCKYRNSCNLNNNNLNNSNQKYIFTSYQYKYKNNNCDNTDNKLNKNIYNSNYNINFNSDNNNIRDDDNNYDYNRKTKPLLRSAKSAMPIRTNCDHTNDKEYLLCQNCINHRLIEEKKRRNEVKKYVPAVFEDKYKNYSQKLIMEKINRREKNKSEVCFNLEKLYDNNDKEKLIKENENAVNPLYQDNHNYLYEKFMTNYEKKQKMIRDNYNKYQNLERPGITSYYNNYVNNPRYSGLGYGEYRPKKYDINSYRKALDEQINYRNYMKKKEEEEDRIRERQQNTSAKMNLENEQKEKSIKKNRIKEELIKGNLELIQAKKKQKELLDEEELKYRDYYNQDKIKYNNDLLEEKAKKEKIKNEFIQENQRNLSKIKRKKVEQSLEKEQYKYNDPSYEPPKEITAECSECHKVYPKKLLTRNAYYLK